VKLLRAFLVLFFTSWVTNVPLAVAKETFDHSLFEGLLKKTVSEGWVDYRALQGEREILRRYLRELAELSPERYADFSREEKLAFWINSYNATAIQRVLEAYPVESLQQITNFWEKKTTFVQRPLSLNDIRNDILRQIFRDERVHCALVFASVGSPRLRPEAYTEDRLDEMLSEDARRFVNDGEKNRNVLGRRKWYLSSLFKSFGTDFLLNYGGSPRFRKFGDTEMAVLSFIADYVDPEKLDYLQKGRYKVRYLPSDDRLNDTLIRQKTPHKP
jgi:hypothetical protein